MEEVAAAAPSRSGRLRSDLSCAPGSSFLHVFPHFGIGGVPLRMCRVINHFGKRFRHTIVALDGIFDAAAQLSPDCDIDLLTPATRGGGILSDTVSAARTLRRLGPDLLLTYNWGSI